MSKRIWTLALTIALGVFATAWLSGAAQAGPASVCGDGVTEGNEECDDSNTVSGDGCSFPSCLPEVCGDNIVNPDPPTSEECDDGNTAVGDGCAADCTCEAEVCGDGIVGCTEECDDGNTIDDDECSNTCTPPAGGELQNKKQAACINAINKNLAGVIKAQNADTATCIKDVSKGKQANTDACLGDDVKGKVGKAQGKTTTTDGKKCQPPKGETPTMAYTAPATVNDAGRAQVLEASTAVLGAAPNVILKADKAGAKCQAEILKHLGAIGNKWAAEANKAKKNALKTVDSEAALAAAIDTAVAASTSLAKAESKANTSIAKKCDDAQADAAADCGGATTANGVTLCVIAAAKEAACNALELADGIDLNCPTIPAP